MQAVLSTGVAIYLFFYVFESVIRYGFNLAGADELIFIRDLCLAVPLLIIFIQQCLRREIHPAYKIFMFVIALHGLVMVLNIGSTGAVIYSAKMLMTMLAGALAAHTLFQPSRRMVLFVLLLWSVTWVAVMLDKYYVEYPWTGLEASIGDVQVEISRDWQITGEDKRAGGFMRSSINVAIVEPLLALILMFNLRSVAARVLVAALTVPVLVWTTQKGAIIAYLLVIGWIALSPKKPIFTLRLGVFLALTLAIALPVIFPGYTMPQAEGVFSFSSFYQRVEDMWPRAWQWIHRSEIFPFGVGLGGIGGPQRLYHPDDVNYVDNIFILMYAYFGVMAFVYLGALAAIVMRVRNDASRAAAHAMATLAFLLGYGCVLSLIEDQMGTLFLGAATAWLCHEIQRQRLPMPAEGPIPCR